MNVDIPTKNRRELLLLGFGIVLIIGGILSNWLAYRRLGIDFYYYHVSGQGWLQGKNIYDVPTQRAICVGLYGFSGFTFIPYPPSTGFAFLPLAALPAHLAQVAWFWLLIFVFAFGIWQLLRHFAPDLNRGWAAVLVGLALLSACVRWAFTPLQIVPLITGMLGLYCVTLSCNRLFSAFFLGATAACLKMTLALPFIAIALLQRRYRLAISIVGIWVLVNLVGFVRFGGLSTYVDYKKNITLLELPSEINSSDPHNALAIMRTDWPFLINGLSTNVQRSKVVSLLLAIIAVAWLGSQAIRAEASSKSNGALVAFLLPVTCLSLLVVYHHHYDGAILITPLLLFLFSPANLRKSPATGWIVWPVLAFFGLYPVQVINRLIISELGNDFVIYSKMIPCVVISTALVASLYVLHGWLRGCDTTEVTEPVLAD